jgi:hypothetical protein
VCHFKTANGYVIVAFSSYFFVSGTDEGAKMSELWKNERYFSSFEEADAMRKSLLSGATGATLQVKVKRCGEEGRTYVVKSRTNPELKAIVQEVEEQMLVMKDKKAKKTKK